MTDESFIGLTKPPVKYRKPQSQQKKAPARNVRGQSKAFSAMWYGGGISGKRDVSLPVAEAQGVGNMHLRQLRGGQICVVHGTAVHTVKALHFAIMGKRGKGRHKARRKNAKKKVHDRPNQQKLGTSPQRKFTPRCHSASKQSRGDGAFRGPRTRQRGYLTADTGKPPFQGNCPGRWSLPGDGSTSPVLFIYSIKGLR